MQRFPPALSTPVAPRAPLILLFERNDAVAVPLIPQLRTAGYDVRAARIPVEVFDLLSHEPVDLVLVDLSNAAANRREFWVGLDSQRRTRTVHVLTFRYMTTLETGELESGLRVARADVEIQGAEGFGPLIAAIGARVPGAVPVPRFAGPPPATPAALPAPASHPAVANNPLAPRPPTGPNPLAPQVRPAPGAGPDDSPFAQPYANNPFKNRGAASPAAPPAPDPFGPRFPAANGNGANAGNGRGATPAARSAPSRNGPPGNVGDYAGGFGAARSAAPASPERPPIDDAWTPPEAAPRAGIAYRGYDDPLAPDDPRIEDSTSPVPVVAYRQAGDGRNERALSSILMDSTAMAPQRLDALRSVQTTLAAVGMEFTISELALLFKFLTPDQLLAALLVSRGLVAAEEIASLGRIKQELLAAGKDYDLGTLLVMFNVLPADQVQALRAELGFNEMPQSEM